MTLRFHHDAIREAELAQAWYDRQQPGLGDDFAAGLDDAIGAILDRPGMWPRDDSTGTRREVRIRTIEPFAYMVVYEIRGEELFVLAVAHHRQKQGYWAGRKA